MKVSMKNGDITQISEQEKQAYIDYIRQKYPDEVIDEIILELDGDDVKIETHKHSKPFNRIRRITGYLVGTMDRWNPGKFAEEHDRVKHTIEETYGGNK